MISHEEDLQFAAMTGRRLPVEWNLAYPYPEVPEYRHGQFGRWTIQFHSPVKIKGYFSGPHIPKYPSWVLSAKDPMTRRVKTWMSLTPMELESHAMQIACAHGIVGVGGLGMGMALFNIMRKPNVTKVFVIEKEASIVQLFRDVTDFDNWVGREKVTIIRRDLLRTEFPTDLDYLYIDIWPNIGDNDVEGDVIKIGKSLKPKEISWWTMEMTFIDWMRKKKIPYHDKSTALIAQWREEFSIPISVGNPDEFLRSLDGVAANVVSGGFT